MNVPVAILVVPSVAIGGALLFGGDASPWARFFAPLFAAQGRPITPVAPITPAISENLTSAIVVIVVAIGFLIAWQRYATTAAQRDAVERLRRETEKMPAVLTNLFYFDAAIDAIFVRPAQALGRFSAGMLRSVRARRRRCARSLRRPLARCARSLDPDRPLASDMR